MGLAGIHVREGYIARQNKNILRGISTTGPLFAALGPVGFTMSHSAPGVTSAAQTDNLDKAIVTARKQVDNCGRFRSVTAICASACLRGVCGSLARQLHTAAG